MIITKTINADLWIRERPQEIHAVQGDTAARRVVVKLFANRQPWNPGTDVSIAVRYRKPDGTGGTYDTLPNGEKAWELTENAVSFLLAPQMLALPGRVEVQAELLAGGSVLASFLFDVLVEENVAAGAVKSRNYFNWLQRLEAKLKEKLKEAKDSGIFDGPVGATPRLQIGTVTTLAAGSMAEASFEGTAEEPILNLRLPKGADAVIDSTLSASGQAADAAAVGAALTGKAPTGFGLGDICVAISSWDTAVKNGFYKADGWFGYAVAYADGTVAQETYGQFSGTLAARRRIFVDGMWDDWEWVNPLMAPGTEYRITERWQGKPVYAYLEDFGVLPNVNEGRKYGIRSGVDQIVSVSLQLVHKEGSYFGGVVPGLASYWAGHSGDGAMYAAVETTKDLSDYTAYFLIKYTKA